MHARSDRLFRGVGGWYFRTREGVDIGPYPTRCDAEVEASLLKALLRGCDAPGDRARVIREFVADAYTLRLPKTAVSTP